MLSSVYFVKAMETKGFSQFEKNSERPPPLKDGNRFFSGTVVCRQFLISEGVVGVN